MDDESLSNFITLGAFASFLIFGWATYCIWRARRSGWTNLAAVYGSRMRRDVRPYRFQTIQFRPAKRTYRWSINARLTVDGLHLIPALHTRCGHDPLLIPWDDIEIFAVETYPADRLYDLVFQQDRSIKVRVGVQLAQLIRRAADNAQYFHESDRPRLQAPDPASPTLHTPAA